MTAKDCTFLIKYFERPASLAILIKSIREFYPDTPIIVGDDSVNEANAAPASPEYAIMRFAPDIGLSDGRNRLVAAAQTEYVLILEEDFEFTDKTNVEDLLDVLRCPKKRHDLAAGSVIQDGKRRSFEGNLELRGPTLSYVHSRRRTPHNHPGTPAHTEYDIVMNFFAARRDTLLAHGWEPTQKLAEHTEYFLRHKGKLSVAHVNQVYIVHHQARDASYLVYRQRAKEFFQDFMRRNRIRKVINFNGDVLYRTSVHSRD